MDRRLFIVIAVVGFHGLALWALQAGLLRRAVELVVPVAVLSELIETPQPQVLPEPPQPKPQPAPAPKASPQPKPAAQSGPQPVAIATPIPEPQAPTGVVEPQPPAPPTNAVAVAAEPSVATPAPTASAAPPKLELPSSSADYLNNPPPPYPPLSKRLGEQGKVVVRAFIETNGTASKAEIRTSSGYERLDQTALQTVLKWRYVPGKRAGVPEAMWFNVPISFVLE